MDQTAKIKDRQWACDQIEQYRLVYPRYKKYGQVLQQVLEKVAIAFAPLAIVQTRPKSMTSFAEKAIRKKNKYRDPLLRMTDLCGGRIITQTPTEVEVISKFIEEHFEIDRGNSVDVSQRLKPTEFGYRSIHYIVQFKRGVFPTKKIPVEIPEELYPDEASPMKAEIQVRTTLEHAWAAFAHDRMYKSTFTIPPKWQRELAVLAGMLEEVDHSFSRIQAGLQTYEASYGAYMSEEQMRNEMEILETVRTCDPQNVVLAHRIGKLAMSLGDWEKARDIFLIFVETDFQPLLRDLGVVLCRIYAQKPDGEEYRQGQKYLEMATTTPNQDADALASLAGTWKNIDEKRARELYQQAFEVDPSDPYPVSNFLVYEIVDRRDLTPVSMMAPAIQNAMQRCRDQADVGMNLPWAFYNLGLFHLLLGQPYESLAAFAKAIQLTNSEWMLETSRRLLERLAVVQDTLPGYLWVCNLLLIGRAVKFPNETVLQQIKVRASDFIKPHSGPVVIVAGGTDARVNPQMQDYRDLLIEAFRDFNGIVISGGTSGGISGLVGNAQQAYPKTIRTIGYVPSLIPANVTIDNQYSQIIYTKGKGFSILEALQYWIDLLAQGMDPLQVKLLGINGGAITAAEYRLALALGATVAIVDGSGREAAKLFQDDNWATSEKLICVPADAMTIRAFIGGGNPPMRDPVREEIAKAIHSAYRLEQTRRKPGQDPSLAVWEKLPSDLKESNRLQADDITRKLSQIGCSLHMVKDGTPQSFTFTAREVEILAEMEHGRWAAEKLNDGWKWASEKDLAAKASPYLVSWAKLPDDVKEWDRETVRKIPQFLANVGMEIRRAERNED